MSRFLIVNTDYSGFLTELYAGHPGLEHEPYAEQLAVRNDSLFGVSDFYPRNLLDLGHPAVEFSINNRSLQSAWAREHGLKLSAAERTATGAAARISALARPRSVGLDGTGAGRSDRRVSS